MSDNVINKSRPKGLSENQVILLQRQFGKNILRIKLQYRLVRLLWDLLQEPMIILLTIACILYFVLGQTEEGILMIVTMAIVTAISISQDMKSSKAIDALKQYTDPKAKVIRNSREILIKKEELVVGDILVMEEGMKIPADASIIQSNDFFINESVITGESFPVEKNENSENNFLYQGSTVESGKCIAEVTAIGNNTMLGKMGKLISEYNYPQTLLQMQVNRFIKKLALFGVVGFLIILLVNYFHYRDFASSLLFALTLAMSALPEEIPVAFSSFMALGAYKMSKLGIISRKPQIIENLGAVTVICLDKTGTITENKMELRFMYDFHNDSIIDLNEKYNLDNDDLLLFAALASESNPFDSMEKAIVNAYTKNGKNTYANYKMIHEYPLEGKPPMMTHVYQLPNNNIIIAAKGAVERIIKVCKLDSIATSRILFNMDKFAESGYRVLAIASANYSNQPFPSSQDDFQWNFMGLLALYDPPKENIKKVLEMMNKASIKIKILTGDFSKTAINIASQIGINTNEQHINGDQVMAMKDDELRNIVQHTSIFTRMFPEAKFKVVNALKANNEIVAMTGDGINDAIALKAADIGIAMGKKGTETARQASDLIITDDDLEKIAIAIREGRKTFNNLLKGIRYIISIHIPIILTASLPVIFGWKYPNIFTPSHIIFLELIMGPTCSVFFENEPIEKDLMLLPPRNRNIGLFTKRELVISIIQGLTITAGVLSLYFFYMKENYSIQETRTMVFFTLILCNIFLTFTSRSFTHTLYYTINYKNKYIPFIFFATTAILLFLEFIPAAHNLFQTVSLTINEFMLCFIVSLTTVIWFEIYKMEIWKSKDQINKLFILAIMRKIVS